MANASSFSASKSNADRFDDFAFSACALNSSDFERLLWAFWEKTDAFWDNSSEEEFIEGCFGSIEEESDTFSIRASEKNFLAVSIFSTATISALEAFDKSSFLLNTSFSDCAWALYSLASASNWLAADS